jgi:transcriptional regulator
MLFEKGWKIPEIARELKISEDDVKKIKKKNKDIIKRKRL